MRLLNIGYRKLFGAVGVGIAAALAAPLSASHLYASDQIVPEKGAAPIVSEDKPPASTADSLFAAPDIEPKIAQINEEVHGLPDHEWAGTYYCGDGLGWNVSLHIAPKAGFAYARSGCLGMYDHNFGSVTVSSTGLHITCQLPNRGIGRERIPDDFIPVRWGQRHYLVGADQMLAFCNSINSGWEPAPSSTRGGRSFLFLMREGDPKTVTGQPQVPAAYQPYLLAHPVQAKILSREPGKVVNNRLITLAVIDAGSADGILPGMEFRRKFDPFGPVATVTTTQAHSAEVQIVQFPSQASPPEIGAELSTKSFR